MSRTTEYACLYRAVEFRQYASTHGIQEQLYIKLEQKIMFFKCPTQESHSAVSFSNQKDEDLWENRSHDATRPKTWKADD